MQKTAQESLSVARARRGLALYLAIVIVLSAVVEWVIIQGGLGITNPGLLIMGLMWMPALASIITRLALREGSRDVSFSIRGRHWVRPALTGWLFPVAVGLIAYGIAWMTGLVTFAQPAQGLFPGVESPILTVALSVAVGMTITTVSSMISAAGEEIGWRGYMIERLIDAGLPHPLLLGGIFWCFWHMPLILSGQYVGGTNMLLKVVMFFVTVIPFSYLIARLRLESGSIWPAIIAHGAWNAVIQTAFDPLSSGPSAGIWVGESGIIVAVVSFIIVILLTRGTWQLRRTPSEEPYRSAKLTEL